MLSSVGTKQSYPDNIITVSRKTSHRKTIAYRKRKRLHSDLYCFILRHYVNYRGYTAVNEKWQDDNEYGINFNTEKTFQDTLLAFTLRY
jgi:hypothetical protein